MKYLTRKYIADHLDIGFNDDENNILKNSLFDESGDILPFYKFKKQFPEKDKYDLAREYNWISYIIRQGFYFCREYNKVFKNQDNLDLCIYLSLDCEVDCNKDIYNAFSPLNNVYLPIDHDFWIKYFPPNFYGDKSTVRAKLEKKGILVTGLDEIILPEPEFSFNFRDIFFSDNEPFEYHYNDSNATFVGESIISPNIFMKALNNIYHKRTGNTDDLEDHLKDNS